LIAEAWGSDRQGDARGLRSYVKMIRQKIEPNPGRPRYLMTETGVGYRLRPDEQLTAN
jgi:two-component system, OmpR family, KDP operon response regulator KdpE